MKSYIEIKNKALVPLSRIFFPIVYDRDKLSNLEQISKLIGMMNLHWMIVYPNFYDCVFYDMKIHHDRFQIFTDTLRMKQDN